MATTKTPKKTPKPPKKPSSKPTATKASPAEGGEAAALKKLCLRIRTTLSGLARADQMAEAKTLYETVYPETRQGGAAGKAGGGKTKNATVASFVRFMAKETGLAPRTIAYDVEIAKGIIPEVKEKLAGTPLANATRDLILISKLSEGRQAVVARKVDEGVAAVRKQLKKWRDKPKPATTPEAQVQTVSLVLAKPVEVRIGTRTCLATLLSIDGSTVSVQIDPAGAQREAVEPLAETSEEIDAPTENVDLQPVPAADVDAPTSTMLADAEGRRGTQPTAARSRHKAGVPPTEQSGVAPRKSAKKAARSPRKGGTGGKKDSSGSGKNAGPPAAILREAIRLAAPFVAKPTAVRVDDEFRNVQVFDSKSGGDGYLFASDSVRTVYFWSEALQGHGGLAIGRSEIRRVLSFLPTRSANGVKVSVGDDRTLLTSGGQALSLRSPTKRHEKLSFNSLGDAPLVLLVDPNELLKAAQFTRASLDRSQSNIEVRLNHERLELRLAFEDRGGHGESGPVSVVPKPVDGQPRKEAHDWAFSTNVDHLITLVRDAKAALIELHVFTKADRGGETALIQTIDEFFLDRRGRTVSNGAGAFKCEVTRFTASNE